MTVELTTQELFDVLLKRLEKAKAYANPVGCNPAVAYRCLQDAELAFEALEIRLKQGSE